MARYAGTVGTTCRLVLQESGESDRWMLAWRNLIDPPPPGPVRSTDSGVTSRLSRKRQRPRRQIPTSVSNPRPTHKSVAANDTVNTLFALPPWIRTVSHTILGLVSRCRRNGVPNRPGQIVPVHGRSPQRPSRTESVPHGDGSLPFSAAAPAGRNPFTMPRLCLQCRSNSYTSKEPRRFNHKRFPHALASMTDVSTFCLNSSHGRPSRWSRGTGRPLCTPRNLQGGCRFGAGRRSQHSL